MLKRLKVRNFAVFTDATIEWSPGLNVIVGENGTGKSQLLKLAYSVGWVSAAQEKAARQSKEELQKRLADKLCATCRPEYLGRLVSRQQGRNRCDVEVAFEVESKVEFANLAEADFAFSFATNAKTEVKIEKMPKAYLPTSPIFIPTREMLSIYPGFASVYENQHLEFDETYYDLAKALSGNAHKKHEAKVQQLIEALESLMEGHIRQDTGRFYIFPNKAGAGKLEIPLVAEGLRKLAMLAYLLINGSLKGRGTLFWDEPETNLNPKLMVRLASALVELAEQGFQVVLATHSLFMLREIELVQRKRKARVPTCFLGLTMAGDAVTVEQSQDIAGIQTLVLLDEELHQSDRYLAEGVAHA